MIQKTNKGFVLLYALLVASIVLVIGLTLSNIILKQLIISSVSREMNAAYYASNAGRECIRFMSAAQGAANSIVDSIDPPGSGAALLSGVQISCADPGNVTVETSPTYEWTNNLPPNPFANNNQLFYTYTDGNTLNNRKACADIDVGPFNQKNNTGENFDFGVVWSRGYNAECGTTGDFNRKVERKLCQEFVYGPDSPKCSTP